MALCPSENLQFNGDPLQLHKCYGHFKGAIDSQSVTDDVKLTFLKTLVTGKAKITIAKIACFSLMYTDALRSFECKFGMPQALVCGLSDKVSTFLSLKMHNGDKIINFSAAITRLIGVFTSISIDTDLKSASLINQVVQKLSLKLKESWAFSTVKKTRG